MVVYRRATGTEVVVIAHYNPLWSGHNLLACVALVVQLSPHTTVCPVMSFVIVLVCCICNIVFTCICLSLLPITLEGTQPGRVSLVVHMSVSTVQLVQ